MKRSASNHVQQFDKQTRYLEHCHVNYQWEEKQKSGTSNKFKRQVALLLYCPILHFASIFVTSSYFLCRLTERHDSEIHKRDLHNCYITYRENVWYTKLGNWPWNWEMKIQVMNKWSYYALKFTKYTDLIVVGTAETDGCTYISETTFLQSHFVKRLKLFLK